MDDQVFSEHIRSRLDGTFDNDPAILTHIKRELKRQLKKIGQWNLSPSYLAFDGESWESSDALDELANEVYIHCIEKRLQKLSEHLAATGTCDGSVRKKISWFLQDRQEKGNPISRRVFRNVRSASESLIEREKAEASPSGALLASTTVLAIGQSIPNSSEELAASFSESLGDRDFIRLVSRNCPASWRTVERVIEKRIDLGLRGYLLSELAKIFAEICKRPDRVTELSEDLDDGFDNIWGSISENRTDVRQGRYLNRSEVDDRDQFAALVQELIRRANKNIPNDRIRARVLRMVDKITELVREGVDVRELSCRKLGDTLNVPKTIVAEDMARLKDPTEEQEARRNEKES
jgi:hypothetical protein